MAAALILLVSIAVAISVLSLDDHSQDLLQRFIVNSISKLCSECLCSVGVVNA